jgi:hypothetical protein
MEIVGHDNILFKNKNTMQNCVSVQIARHANGSRGTVSVFFFRKQSNGQLAILT